MANRNEQKKNTRKFLSRSRISASSPSITLKSSLPVLFGGVFGRKRANTPSRAELAAVISRGILVSEISL